MPEQFTYAINNLPLADLYSSYESGTFLEFKNTRYHVREAGIGGQPSGAIKFFTEAVGQNGVTIGETNMLIPSQMEKGNWLSINKIAVKVSQRNLTADESTAVPLNVADGSWYNLVLMTLFKYGLIRFRINGLDHIGEFKLSELIPSIQSINQFAIANQGTMGSNVLIGGVNTAPIMAAGVFNLCDRSIKLSELVNFWVELIWDIPQRYWRESDRSWQIIPAVGSVGSAIGFVPNDTVVEIQLIGEQLRAQG
jgi:hypothetical protein